MDDALRKSALEYHIERRPGKIEVTATKALANQRDLALAYSPGVAAPCEEIAADPGTASIYTNRANLVAVITNGSAVLGLGDIGALAAKPVMEGKAVLFKKFAGIDVFDLEIDESDPDRLVEIIASLAPSFGGVNLEDIKSPECFYIEQQLRERCGIPIFHDDQHGTAIITGAAVLNALRLVDKRLEDVRLVTSGAGAAAIACLKLLVSMGLSPANVLVTDRKGVVHADRLDELDEYKAQFAQPTAARSLADAIVDADVFLGLSAPGVLTPGMVATMAMDPIILALANPTPEIMPEDALAVRPDAIVATGRSDYPNQVNNVLCFPYIFRGALDVGASTITEEMKVACVEAIANLATQEASEIVLAAYKDENLSFGREYLIPKPFDPRLITCLAPAVAAAAMRSGVATHPIEDMDAYRDQLAKFVFHSMLLMRPILSRAKREPQRIVYADGEEDTVLRAVQSVFDEGLARPILVGRPAVIERRTKKLGLRLRLDDIEIVNPEKDARYREYWITYHDVMKRKGVSPQQARTVLRTSTTVIAALMVRKGHADAMLCGLTGRYEQHLRHLIDLFGVSDDVISPAALNVLILRKGNYFICDTAVNGRPSADLLADITIHAAQRIQQFGLTPKAALLSHSSFGSRDDESARRMREALQIIRRDMPELEIDGEMQANLALLPDVRQAVLPDSTLEGVANLLVMPNIEAANIAMNLLAVTGEGVAVGPILMGLRRPAHILPASASVRRVINMTALAAVDAQMSSTDCEPA